MNEKARYRGLIVEPDLNTRNRLKQAALELHDFSKIEFAASLKEALRRVTDDDAEQVDVFFISYRFEVADVRQFISQALKTLQGVDAAYITLMKTFDRTGAAVAARLLEGADGLLQEPYSVDGLKEVNEVAARVKRERASLKAALAVKMLAKDVAKRFEIYSFLKRWTMESGSALRALRESCAQVHALSPESKALYLEQAIDVFIDFPLLYSPFEKYDGASNRVRKHLTRCMTSYCENELDE